MIALLDTPLDAAPAARDRSADPEHGGTALFVGSTRRDVSEREVVELRYEVYEELALSEMHAIVAEAERGFGARVSIVAPHRGRRGRERRA